MINITRILYTKFNYIILGYVAFCILIPKLPLFFINNYPTPVRAEDFLWVILVILGIYVVIHQKVSVNEVIFSKISIAILIWFFIILISTLINISSNNIPFTNLLFFVRFVQYVSLFYLSMLFPFTQNQFKRIIKVLILITCVVILWSLMQFFGFIGGYGGGFYNYQFIHGTDRVFASFSGPYELAGYLLLVLPIIILSVIISSTKVIKAILLTIWVLGVITLGFSGARFPILVASVSILPLMFIKFSLRNMGFLILIGILTFAIPFFTSKTIIDRFSTLTISQAEYQAQLIPTPTPTLTPTITPTQIPLPTITPTVSLIIIVEPTNKPTDSPVSENPTVTNIPTLTPIPTLIFIPTISISPKLITPSPTESVKVGAINEISKPINALLQVLASKDRSLDLRINVNWPLAWVQLSQNPFLGGGLGAVGVGLDGEYITLLGESGIIGLVVFLSIFILIVCKLIRLRKLKYEKNGLIELALSLLLVMLVSGFLSDNFRASKIAILFWFLIGVLISQIDQVQQTKNENSH